MIHVFIRLIYLSAALCTALYVLLCVFPCLAIKVPHRALYAVVLLLSASPSLITIINCSLFILAFSPDNQ